MNELNIENQSNLVIVEVKIDSDNKMYLEPINDKLNKNIIVNEATDSLVEGMRILVKINELDKNNNCYKANIVKYLGHKNDPDNDIKMIALNNGIKIGFSEESLNEAQNIPTKVLDKDKTGRLNLTDEMIFSIDGVKTKDRDDAISLKKTYNGGYILGVHIADVSYYVHPGMKLWDEALMRGTSAYLANTVIPMLPHKLSDGICSLNPNVERLAFSCIIEFDARGNILNYNFVDTVIKSKKAMTYEDVNEFLENDNVVEGYEEFTDNLLLMDELAQKLERKKVKRGYVEFGSNDIEITLNEDGNPKEIKPKQNQKAQKIIENFMLAAGECAANYVVIPSPYRIHEQPDSEKIEEAFELIQKSGIKVKSSEKIANCKEIQNILNKIKNMEERQIAANIILRSMKRAKYSVDNVGHFALGLQKYGQFTSPIRRANDLVMHYNIRMQRDKIFDQSKIDEYYEDMVKLCYHISKKERDADRAEKDAEKFIMAKYIDERLGQKFIAHVTYVNPHGIYIKTIEGIEGVITKEDLEGDDFYFDERTNSFKGKKSKIKISLGQEILITAVDTKREYKTINFGIDEEDFMTLKIQKKASN